MSWQERALCAQVDPELWFPEKGGPVRAVKRICQRCPVRAECLSYALTTNQQHGIWGGLTHPERLELSRAEPGQVAA